MVNQILRTGTTMRVNKAKQYFALIDLKIIGFISTKS